MCVETRVEGRKNEEKVGEKQRERRGPKRRNTERERGLPEIIPEDQRGAVRSNSKEWQ